MNTINKILISLMTLVLCFSLITESVIANVSSEDENQIQKDQQLYNEEIDEINEMIRYEKYISQNSLGDKYANNDLMVKDNLTEEEKLLVKEIALSYNNFAREGKYTPKAFFKFHGRYCGKGNLGGKPEDRLDAACKKHDECYAKHGWGKCKCDYPFVATALSVAKNKKYSPKYRNKAKVAAYLFGVKYSQCVSVKTLFKRS